METRDEINPGDAGRGAATDPGAADLPAVRTAADEADSPARDAAPYRKYLRTLVIETRPLIAHAYSVLVRPLAASHNIQIITRMADLESLKPEGGKPFIPDLVLLSATLPDLDQQNSVVKVRGMFPLAKVALLVYSWRNEMTRSGVHGYVTTEMSGLDFVQALKHILSGGDVMYPPEIARAMMTPVSLRDGASAGTALRLIGARGQAVDLNQKDIALIDAILAECAPAETGRLLGGKSTVTVKKRRKALYEKFGVASQTSLIILVASQGYCRPGAHGLPLQRTPADGPLQVSVQQVAVPAQPRPRLPAGLAEPPGHEHAEPAAGPAGGAPEYAGAVAAVHGGDDPPDR
jgi:DNA-binding NarL/FixJ family response regulator